MITFRPVTLRHQHRPMGRGSWRVRRDVRASRTLMYNLVRWWWVIGGGGRLRLRQNCPRGDTRWAASARVVWPSCVGAVVGWVRCWEYPRFLRPSVPSAPR